MNRLPEITVEGKIFGHGAQLQAARLAEKAEIVRFHPRAWPVDSRQVRRRIALVSAKRRVQKS